MRLVAPLLLLLSGVAFAAERSDKVERPRMAPNVPAFSVDSKDFNFPSGLRVMLQADHSQPLVGVTMYIDRGSADDPAGYEGIAHFVEHLWFRSEHGDLPKVMDLINDMGCTFNASTADDFTNYMTVCPADALPHLIRLESLRLTDPIAKVQEDAVDIEREVIRNELRMRKENGFMGALPYIYEKLYTDDHPYARGGIGSHESLTNIKLKDIVEFTENHYVPENTTIVIVGDFDPDNAANLLFENLAPAVIHPKLTPEMVKRFGRPDVEGELDPANPAHWTLWPSDPDSPDQPLELTVAPQRIAQEGEPPPPAEPADTTPGYYQAPVEYATVVVAWSVPGGYRGETPVGNVAANMASSRMLGYLQSGDLPGVRKDKYGNAQGGCFLWESKVDSKIICMAEVTDVKYGENTAEKMIDQLPFIWDISELPEMRQIQESWWSRQRQMGVASILHSLDTVAALYGRATQVAQHAHYTGSHTYHSDLMNQTMEVKTMEVAQWAHKYLKRNRAVTVILEPIPEEERVLDSSEAAYHGARREDDTLNSAYDPKNLTPKVIQDAMVIPEVEKIQEKTLENGLRVVVLDHGETPSVKVSLVFGGGTATDTEGIDDFANIFSRTVWDETDDFGFPAMAWDPLTVAGNWEMAGGGNYSTEGMKVPSGNLDAALFLLRSAQDKRAPDLAGKPAWVKRRQTDVVRNWRDEDWWADKFRDEHLNSGHPSSKRMEWDDYDAMKSWSNAKVEQYLASKYQPKNATLLIVGDLGPAGGPEKTMELAESYFSGWNAAATAGAPPTMTLPPPNTPQPAKVYLFDDPKNTQTQIQFVCQVAQTTPENIAATQMAGDLINQQAWTILREKSGVTYGAGAYAWTLNGGTSFLVLSSLVQNSAASLGVEVFRDLVNKVENGDVDEDRLSLLKFNRAKKYVLGQQSIDQMTDRLTNVIGMEQDWTYFQTYRDALSKVDAGALTQAMGSCSDNAYISITGPKKYVGPKLEEAGISFEELEWKEMGEALWQEKDPKGYKKWKKQQEKDNAKRDKELEEAESAGEEAEE